MPRKPILINGRTIQQNTWCKKRNGIILRDSYCNSLATRIENHSAVRAISIAVTFDALLEIQRMKTGNIFTDLGHCQMAMLKMLEILDSLVYSPARKS